MKRRIFTTVAFVAFSLSAVSCGGQATTEPAATPSVNKEANTALLNSIDELTKSFEVLEQTNDDFIFNVPTSILGDFYVGYTNLNIDVRLKLQKTVVKALEIVAANDKSYEAALAKERTALKEMEENMQYQ